MDETIQQTTALTPEDERLLYKYADALIAEEGAVIPAAIEDMTKITCAAPPDLVENIYRRQPKERLIVITHTPMAAELARVLNRSFKSNHFALCDNGTWDAEVALDEIRHLNSMLIDDAGNELRIAEPIIPGIFASADGRILAADGFLTELGGKPLYGKQFHDAWGTLLPAQFTKETLADDSMSFLTRTFAITNLHAQMKKRGDEKVPIPEHTLVFGAGRCLVTEWETAEDRDAALRRVFFLMLFGTEEGSDALAAMLPVLTETEDIPEAFLQDLERIYVNGAPCSFRKWNNILERLMLDYEENGTLKGGAAE